MCDTGSPCGCAGSPGGSGIPAVLAVLVLAAAVAAFIAAHLVLIAAGAVAVAAGTLAAVLWLRRFMIPEGRERLARPAARRVSRAAVTARPVRALPAPQRRAIGAARPVLSGRVLSPGPARKPAGGAR